MLFLLFADKILRTLKFNLPLKAKKDTLAIMLLTLLAFVFVLAILVLAHEFGHFVVARKNGIKVDEFGFGFPPRFIGIQRVVVGVEEDIREKIVIEAEKEVDNISLTIKPKTKWKIVWGNKEGLPGNSSTIYSLNWIPLGGFVKIKGEDGEESTDPDSFINKKIWQRTFVLCAGVLMNIVLAAVLLGVGYMIGLPQSVDNLGYGAKVSDAKIEIMSVLSGFPAKDAGLQAGDEIAGLDSLSNLKVADLQNYLSQKEGQKVFFTIKRNNEMFQKEIIPAKLKETSRGGIGVVLLETAVVSYPWYLAIWHGFIDSVFFAWEVVKAFALLIANIFRGAAGVTENLAGPVGIAVLTGKAAKLGLGYLLQFMALLSINLAVLNILPFPALDGGRVLFLLIEKVRGRPVARKMENAFHTLGFAVLMLLVLFVTIKDVGNFKWIFVNLWHKIF
ncbi:MAG TPA: RIP metalloprotease RseP [Candidatus Magasanikbacteria bacterium]|nr:MAG: RIP metalloprotease RseP [Candidatus Magasanikbacteria bacterium RIFOXYB2_FULL_38_10]HBV58026.1 RIP metalloprotease RseP [Candidatus Magasanikbacteria bacterium]